LGQAAYQAEAVPEPAGLAQADLEARAVRAAARCGTAAPEQVAAEDLVVLVARERVEAVLAVRAAEADSERKQVRVGPEEEADLAEGERVRAVVAGLAQGEAVVPVSVEGRAAA
jgi:hypothetical protein